MWVDYFNGTITEKTNKLDELLGDELLAIGDLILVEILQGFADERDLNQARQMLAPLTIVDLVS